MLASNGESGPPCGVPTSDQTVGDRGNSKHAQAAVELGYFNPSHRLRPVSPCVDLLAHGRPVFVRVGGPVLYGHAVNARRSLVQAIEGAASYSKKPDRCVVSMEIDHLCAATLAVAGSRPTYLSAPTPSANEIPSFRVRCNEIDELFALSARPELFGIALEDGVFRIRFARTNTTALPYLPQAILFARSSARNLTPTKGHTRLGQSRG